ncbi:MAG: outer membrane protein assembly factor BamA [Alphaproteobacteria bacterium]|nr:outer membrane protein assembly factor BamA [Alphaproteobacteria bacterium]MBQ9234861.1 outer membrane protein assembly factor BamA [Alphaproteobacteria bacterium]
MKKTGLGTFICCLLASTSSLAAGVYVKDIKISGLERVEPETVLSYINIKKGSTTSDEAMNAALKNLYSTGLFEDISINVDSASVMQVKVSENPIISQVLFDGNDKIDDDMLTSEVRLSPRSTYSRAKVQEDVRRIMEVYRRAGRYATVVNPEIIRRDQNRVDLIFNINEGPAAVIDKINFIGNEHYSSKELQEVIMSKESRWYRIFSSSENYDAEKTEYDKELLRRFYLKKGYADFRVISNVAELSPDKKSFTLTFVVDEGAKYKINNVNITSDIKEVNVAEFNDLLEVEDGDTYNLDNIDKTVTALTDELGKKGFAFVDVTPEVDRNSQAGEADITFHIKEGERFFIDRINIHGNTRTHDKVIRRELRLEEGDAFNASKIKDSRRNLDNLDYFEKIDINTTPKDGNRADLDVDVKEKSTGYFNVGVGYSTVNGALVRTGVTENNFRGVGQQLGFDVAVSQKSQDFDVSFTEPYFLDRRLRAGVDLFHSRQDYQDESSYDSKTTGGRLRTGWNYTDDLSQQLRYTLKEDEITSVGRYASKYIKAEEGKYTGSSFGTTLVYDKRDSANFTRDGYFLSAGGDIAGAGGDEKYYKFDGKAYWYYTMMDYYTLKFFANAGYIEGYGGKPVRLANRYFLGGYTMRGFDVGGIGARDKYTDDALGGNWMVYTGAELGFPIGLDELGLSAHVFTDVGTLGKPDNIDRADVYYSDKPRVAVGFGFQWLSPMGQIDIDFGFPIVKEKYDETEVFRLNFGTRL